MKGEDKALDHREFETYQAEVKEKWGQTDAYKEYEAKGDSKDKWNDLSEGMDHIMELFALCMKQGENPDSSQAQALVKSLQTYISENFYHCTNKILAGLGQMYVGDDRFKNNIDQHADGTAVFVSKAIAVYCDPTH